MVRLEWQDMHMVASRVCRLENGQWPCGGTGVSLGCKPRPYAQQC